jgi:hypothetical protein
MLLKGGALAYTAYPSFSERPMGDIDLLVPAGCGEKAWRLAQTAGWRWPAEEYPLQRYEAHHHWPPLIDQFGAGVCLEIHTDHLVPGHPFEFSSDSMWREAITISVRQRSLLVPAPLHLLLHTCIHFAWSHSLGLGAWRTFRDVWALIETAGIDWSAFVKLANETRASSCAYWTLRLAHTLTNAPVPIDAVSPLRPPGTDFNFERCERHFLLSLFPSERICPSVRLSRAMWELGIRPASCGHGSVRPWQFDDPILRAEPGPRQARGPHHIVRYAKRWRLWALYVRGLFLSRKPEHDGLATWTCQSA